MSYMLLTKVRNRVLRQVLRFPPVRNRSDRAYQADLARHKTRLPPLGDFESTLATKLNETGVVVTSLDALAGPGGRTILRAAQEVAKTSLTASVNKIGFVAHAPTDEMARVPEIYRWGMEQPLGIVEHGLGLPVAYHGVYLRRDLANTVVSNSRLWHRDTEDRRILKIIIYLNDVGEDGGAFQYLSRSLTTRISAGFHGRYGFYSDEQVSRVTSPAVLDQIQTCTGPAGTVVIADTAGTYHRGRLPEKEDRLALFYDYTSRNPLHSFLCKSAFTPAQEQALTAGLSEVQRACVFWRPDGLHHKADVF